MVDVETIKKQLRIPYMSGVLRSSERVNKTHEFFTPTDLVERINNWLASYDQSLFSNPTKTFLDHSCGDGQILSEALIRKLENGIDFETALSTIYGVDLMPDNVKLCQDRLICGREDLRHIVEQNIVCADALRYHYRFDGSHPYDDEVKAKQKEDHLNSLFIFE